jgi:hypothetical protein
MGGAAGPELGYGTGRPRREGDLTPNSRRDSTGDQPERRRLETGSLRQKAPRRAATPSRRLVNLIDLVELHIRAL